MTDAQVADAVLYVMATVVTDLLEVLGLGMAIVIVLCLIYLGFDKLRERRFRRWLERNR